MLNSLSHPTQLDTLNPSKFLIRKHPAQYCGAGKLASIIWSKTLSNISDILYLILHPKSFWDYVEQQSGVCLCQRETCLVTLPPSQCLVSTTYLPPLDFNIISPPNFFYIQCKSCHNHVSISMKQNRVSCSIPPSCYFNTVDDDPNSP